MAPKCLRRTQLSEVGWQSIPHSWSGDTECSVSELPMCLHHQKQATKVFKTSKKWQLTAVTYTTVDSCHIHNISKFQSTLADLSRTWWMPSRNCSRRTLSLTWHNWRMVKRQLMQLCPAPCYLLSAHNLAVTLHFGQRHRLFDSATMSQHLQLSTLWQCGRFYWQWQSSHCRNSEHHFW